MQTQLPLNAGSFNSILIGITQFEIIPEPIQEYFYAWNVFDGTYLEDHRSAEFAEANYVKPKSKRRRLKSGGDGQECDKGDGPPSQLCANGYESIRVIENLGTIFIGNLILFVFIILELVLRIIRAFPCCKCLTKISNRLHNSIYWNPVIRLILESYLEFSIAA